MGEGQLSVPQDVLNRVIGHLDPDGDIEQYRRIFGSPNRAVKELAWIAGVDVDEVSRILGKVDQISVNAAKCALAFSPRGFAGAYITSSA